MKNKAWVVTVDMGYGHQRAAYPLRHLSPQDEILIANNYLGIPRRDFRLWHGGQRLYEFVSRLNNVPLVGERLFGAMDYFQRIDPFYPRRDLSRPSTQLTVTYKTIRGGWGKDLVRLLNQENVPLISTFFTIAYMAEEHGFKGDIYQIICDTDVSRAWAPLNPSKSRIKYLAPCRRVVERLKLYGVRPENIFLTGFPVPSENIGDQLKNLKQDVAERIINLDPEHRYREKYAETVKQFLKGIKINARHHHPLTLTFAVGGAGAQKTIARDILTSLKQKLLGGEINLILVAGTRSDVSDYFNSIIKQIGLGAIINDNLKIVWAATKQSYFEEFNRVLRTTDILWTKPSELVFYSALGIPLIMAPSLGSQEVYNRTWLKTIGAGISQNDPRYTHEWLFDWVNSGFLAEAAMNGYLDKRQFGIDNIKDVIFRGATDPSRDNELL
ncbi:MAG: hypothetical protein EXS55_02425 [Candidatus Magasanikbacteria bacterium]|nr:hypothetical protein [Candidatus Magasanikbacteria bacterium]